MEQPPGYIDSRYPNYVYHLKKALALSKDEEPFGDITKYVYPRLGFTNCRVDTYLFVLRQASYIL